MKEDNSEFENLYKKAAENFPLKTDNADWQSVLSALEEEYKKTPFFINKKFIALGLLLFLVSFLYISTLINHKNNTSNSNVDNRQVIKQNEELQQQNSKLKQEITDAVYKRIYDSINSQKKRSDNSNTEAKKSSVFDIKNKNKTDNNKPNYISNNISFNSSKQQKNTLIHTQKNISNKTKGASANQKNYNLTNNSSSLQTESTQEFQSKKNQPSFGDVYREKNQLNYTIDNANSETVTIQKSDSVTKPLSKTLVVDSLKKLITFTPNKSSKKFNKYFYVGALYAFDNTAEKNEKHSNEKGENFGISFLLGYKISPKISIETGVSYQNKEYYTSGNYFNKSILGATGNVNGIEAENSFIEIPITLKYDWFNKKQHSIFTTIGLSSYFVNKEKYEYEQEIAGVYNKQYVEFSTVTTNLFASCNFSFGYQFNLKKLGNIRVQPYINLPLKGLGKSQEYLVSKGINIGWIYSFNKK